MINKIQEIVGKIANPATGKTLTDEKRIIEITEKNDQFYIKYKRDGIGPLDKRKIEESILNLLKDIVDIEKVNVVTISDRSQEVYNAMSKTSDTKESPNQKIPEAQLKVGHAQVGNKKPVIGVKKIIGIASGKGGVGKSTLSVNLAATLVSMGKKVGLIDSDIYGPSIPTLMGKKGEKPYSNSEKKIIPLEAHGIKFMSFGLFIAENEPVIWRGPMLGGVLSQFLFDVDWGELDYLFIDLPPGTGDIQLSMIQNTNVDGVIIISTPQEVALLDAVKGLEMFRKVNIPIIGMIENMSSFICSNCGTSHDIFGKSGVEKKARELSIPFLGAIPLELELRKSSDEGLPYMANKNYEGRNVWKAYTELAKTLGQGPEMGDNNKKGFIKRIFG